MNKAYIISILAVLAVILSPACSDKDSGGDTQSSQTDVQSSSNSNQSSAENSDFDKLLNANADTHSNNDSVTNELGLSSGCGLNPPALGEIVDGPSWGPGPDHTYHVNVKGTDRSYVLRYPANYDKTQAYPLVFLFHGTGGNGAEYDYTWVEQTAGRNRAIFVLPNGLDYEWAGDKGWDTFGVSERDLAFFDVMWEKIRGSYCVNESRVFASGHSIGGYMTNYLACERGDVLRAIAPIASGGSWIWALGDPAHPCKGNVASMVVHGTADDTVAYQWGVDTLNYFLKSNACSQEPSPGAHPQCESYQSCTQGLPVEMCTFTGVNHSNYNWTEVGKMIWRFFDSQPALKK